MHDSLVNHLDNRDPQMLLCLHEEHAVSVAVLGDGDTRMGISALWTVARHEVPMLASTSNNRSCVNTEIHQEKVGIMRGRPVGKKAQGQAIAEPALDFAGQA